MTRYRDDSEVLLARREVLFHERSVEAEKAGLMPPVFAQRVARICAGLALIAAGALLAGGAIYNASYRGHLQLDHVLTLAWPVALAVYVVTLLVSRRAARAVLVRPVMTRDLAGDVARFEQESPLEIARDRANALERASVGLPMIGISLCLPLTIHWLVAAAFLNTGDFDTWIMVSLAIVGHAHIALAIACWMFARTLSMRSVDVLRRPDHHGWTVLAVVAGVSCVPGLLFFAVPPLLVLITGLFIPLMFALARRLVCEERDRLGIVAPPTGAKPTT
jgi:hypothetical protein